MRLVQDLEQILAIRRFGQRRGQAGYLLRIDVTHPVSDLLRAGDLEPLPLLDRLDERTGLQQGLVGTGVEPRRASPENLDLELTRRQVAGVHIRNLQLAPR